MKPQVASFLAISAMWSAACIWVALQEKDWRALLLLLPVVTVPTLKVII